MTAWASVAGVGTCVGGSGSGGALSNVDHAAPVPTSATTAAAKAAPATDATTIATTPPVLPADPRQASTAPISTAFCNG